MRVPPADSWDFKQSTRNISPTINQANIVDLHPASVYSIRMYSFNKIGRSEPSKELTVSTEEAGELLARPVVSGAGTAGAHSAQSTGSELAVRRGKGRGGPKEFVRVCPGSSEALRSAFPRLGFWELSVVLPSLSPSPACLEGTDLQRVQCW